jgi:hypothetical protein
VFIPGVERVVRVEFGFCTGLVEGSVQQIGIDDRPSHRSVSATTQQGWRSCPARTAHILVSVGAVHGLKHTAKTSMEWRELIEELSFLALPHLTEVTKKTA